MIPIISAMCVDKPDDDFYQEIINAFDANEIGSMLERKYNSVGAQYLTYEMAKDDIDDYNDKAILRHNNNYMTMSRLWIDEKTVYKYRDGKFLISKSTPSIDIENLRLLSRQFKELGIFHADVLILKILAFDKYSPALFIKLKDDQLYYGNPKVYIEDEYDEDEE